MPRPLLRGPIIAALALAFALLSGCSALRLGYGQADGFLFRYLDRYAEFDDAQSLKVREGLAAWFAWHRRTQLPDYAELLARLEAEVLGDTTPERVCAWWGEVRTRADRAFEQAIPTVVDVATTLKPAQFASIEKQQAKTNAEYRDDFLQADAGARRKAAVKRMAGRAEWLYGDLLPVQRERLVQAAAEAPGDPAIAYEERERRQQDALQTLRRVASGSVQGAAAVAEMRAWLQRLERSPREAYRAQAARQLEHNCRVAADLHNAASPAQRKVASARLKGWATDLRVLAGVVGG